MPDFDFDAYNHDTVQDGEGGMSSDASAEFQSFIAYAGFRHP